MPQSAVYRRRQIDNAKLKGERIVQKEILPVLQSRYKSLSRELRQSNLRKKLKKDGAYFEKAQPTWQSWANLFEKTLVNSLSDGAGFVWDAETRYFTSMNYPTFPFHSGEVLAQYQARVGTQITNIAANTEVYVNQAITDWYKTDAGLPELIGMLETFFSSTRAELIAATEMAYVASEVAYGMMDNYNIELWTWDAFQDAVTCDICFDLMEQSKANPFTRNDPMPPDPSHPKCRCGVYFLGVDVNVKKWTGADFNKGWRNRWSGGGSGGGRAWQRPSRQALETEYHVEEELKHLGAFSSKQEFLDAVDNAPVVEVTPEMDRDIAYRSRTTSRAQLTSLIQSYASYPQYRNEQTLDTLYERIGDGEPMDMPIVLDYGESGGLRVFSGNTRMDVAFQLGTNPNVLLVQVP